MEAKLPEEVLKRWKSYKTKPTTELRNRLMTQYHPLVKYHGERVWARLPDGVELDDLISAGVFGLMDAIDAFDLTRGVKFETYCVPRIRGALLDELRSMDWVPRLVRSKATKLNTATKKMEDKLGRPATPQDLAEVMELTVPELEKILYQPISVLDHGFVRVIDYMGDDSAIVQSARVSYGKGTKKISNDQGLSLRNI